jgi:transcriptional regulator with XRE-family HTH domain
MVGTSFWTGGTWAQQRVQYLSKNMSLREIARETGIPRSTLGYVWRGERQLPTDYVTDLETTYRKGVYANLREVGVSVEQSQLYRYLSPSMASSLEARMETTINRLSLGAYAAAAEKMNRQGLLFDPAKLFPDMKARVTAGLRASDKTIEEKENY